MGTSVLVVGAGTIGTVIARLLAQTGDYAVMLADRDAGRLGVVAKGVTTARLDAGDGAALDAACRGRRVVVSAASHAVNPVIAAAAARNGAAYFDLTEDIASSAAIARLAADAPTLLMPQCGLAPGFVSVAAGHLAQRLERVEAIRIRVGALPRFPDNALGYMLSWSTDGLINEYSNPCEALRDGSRVSLPPLDGLERLVLDGVSYEAFNTSGGLGTLVDSWAGRARDIDYKTLRYPGHRDAMRLLLEDLRLKARKDLLKEILEHALPARGEDLVVIYVAAIGDRDGVRVLESYFKIVRPQAGASAIQATTAAAACAVIDLHVTGRLAGRGLVRQEQVDYREFLDNRFGRLYRAAQNGDPQ